jgi:hypothetical protein
MNLCVLPSLCMSEKMRKKIKAFVLALLFTCFGCATITFLPTDDSAKYPPTDSIEIYWKEPHKPYYIIGKVSAKSEDFGEDTLYKMLKKKAMAAGAHAIIMGGTSQGTSVVTYPMYGGGATFIPITSTRLEGIAIRFVGKD